MSVPLSENTIVNEILASGYDVANSFDDDVPSSSEEVVDDTDEDPTYDPNPRPNHFRIFSVSNRPRLLDFDVNAPGTSNRVTDERMKQTNMPTSF